MFLIPKIISKKKENNKTNDKANKQIMTNNHHLENHLGLIHDHWVSVLWHEQCVARMGTTGILPRIPEEARQASHNIAHMPKIQGQSLVVATEISATIQYSICGKNNYKCAPFSFRKLAWTTENFCNAHVGHMAKFCHQLLNLSSLMTN